MCVCRTIRACSYDFYNVSCIILYLGRTQHNLELNSDEKPGEFGMSFPLLKSLGSDHVFDLPFLQTKSFGDLAIESKRYTETQVLYLGTYFLKDTEYNSHIQRPVIFGSQMAGFGSKLAAETDFMPMPPFFKGCGLHRARYNSPHFGPVLTVTSLPNKHLRLIKPAWSQFRLSVKLWFFTCSIAHLLHSVVTPRSPSPFL